MKFSGVYTALVTPFRKDGSIDEEALRKLIDRQITGGVAGLVPMGTTGESPTLDHDEHLRVIELVVGYSDGRVPIIAGTGSNSTAEAIKMTRKAEQLGVTASLQVAPYYNKPMAEGFYRHFAAIADAVDIPIVVYNIQSRTAKNIENETMLRLAEIPNIAGVKESSGDLKQVMELIANKPSDFAVLSGDDNVALPITLLGGNGVVSVASNIIPARMVSLVDAALRGDLEEARKQHYELLPLFAGLFIETNPIPIKHALARAGNIEEVYRLPMSPMAENSRQKLGKILDDFGL